MLPVLTTERLVLRPLQRGLAVAIAGGDLSGVSAGSGWPHAESLTRLRILADQPEQTGDDGWLIALRADDVVIGDCGWHGGPDADGVAEVGYGLSPSYRGRGYGTEAVTAMVEWCEQQPGVRRLLARVQVDNAASRRIVERLGFTVELLDDGWTSYERQVRR